MANAFLKYLDKKYNLIEELMRGFGHAFNDENCYK